ncbi:hypothetical protein EMIT0180MI3_12360 [Priestia megaterium]
MLDGGANRFAGSICKLPKGEMSGAKTAIKIDNKISIAPLTNKRFEKKRATAGFLFFFAVTEMVSVFCCAFTFITLL